MKNIVFAMKMAGVTASTIEKFEDKIYENLKRADSSYALGQSFHCDYKEGLLSICKKVKPDLLIVNESLPGKLDFMQLIRDIKSDLPDIQVIVLLTKDRPVGDALLASLVTLGIYNWVVSPWSADSIAEVALNPKKLKDVETYMPRIIEGENGLAFDTKIISKEEVQNSTLEDLPENMSDNFNNRSAVERVDEIEDVVEDSAPDEERKETVYHTLFNNGGYAFGQNIAVPKKTQSLKEVPIKFTQSVVPEKKKEPQIETMAAERKQGNENKKSETKPLNADSKNKNPNEKYKNESAKTGIDKLSRVLSHLDDTKVNTKDENTNTEHIDSEKKGLSGDNQVFASV